MAAACPDDRLIVIEDTTELQCAAANVLTMRASLTVGLSRLVRTALRFSPKRIIVGVVRGGEALELIKAWNTGLPGGIATIHANSAREALPRLEDLIREATAAPMARTIAAAVHHILFVAKTDGGRRLEALIRIEGLAGDDYRISEEG
jgi:type IV secretion system protein VirB11